MEAPFVLEIEIGTHIIQKVRMLTIAHSTIRKCLGPICLRGIEFIGIQRNAFIKVDKIEETKMNGHQVIFLLVENELRKNEK